MKRRIKFHQTKSWLDMPKLANLSMQVLENFCQIIMKYTAQKLYQIGVSIISFETQVIYEYNTT
jgi:hypothetical protein